MEKMVRKASDNKYLHRDFHNILNLGLDYVVDNYGVNALYEYLTDYAKAFHRPLIDSINEKGLVAVKKYFVDIYTKEEAIDDVTFEMNDGELIVNIKKCPAVSHMLKSNIIVSPYYIETAKTVYRAICEGTSLGYEMICYNKENGASKQRFYKKEETL